MRLMKTTAAALSIALLAAGPAAACDLEGIWEFKVVAGDSRGDFGEIEITRSDDDAWVGRMNFTDSRFMLSADQSCEVVENGDEVTITCEVFDPNWVPDDFALVRDGVDHMSGAHISNYSGEALFRRSETCNGLSS